MKFLLKNINREPWAYIILAIFLVFCLILFFLSGNDPHSHRRLVYIATAGYFGWSLLHHYRRGDLSLSIIIEYLLMGLLAILVISSTFVFL